MTRMLRNLGDSVITSDIFNCFVRLEFCAAAETAIFRRQPANIIRRRHSNIRGRVVSPPPPSLQVEANHDTSQPARVIQRRQSESTVLRDRTARRYISPEDLGSAIQNIRRRLGKFLFSSVFML